MSNLKIIYSQDKLSGNPELKFDKDGYAWLQVGAYNIINSAGQKYVFTDKVKKVYDDNGSLQQRVKGGQLYGEHGHPKLKPGMSIKEFGTRLGIIDEKCISTHHKEVKLQELPDGTIGVFSLLKGHGVYGDLIDKALKDPNINLAYSVRSLSMGQVINGVLHKEVYHVTTWDDVSAPGIAGATKFNTLKHGLVTVDSKDMLNFDAESKDDMAIVQSLYEDSKRDFGLESASTELFGKMLNMFACDGESCKFYNW